MKIQSIKLHPFAGIKNQTYTFNDNLKVIQGPNEAGKSTLFNAILNSFVTTTSLTSLQLENEMGRYFPASGGDVIRLTMILINRENEEIIIHKTWKKGNRNGSASIKLPDGTEITDEESVQAELGNLIPVSSATLRAILLADQSSLHKTLEQIKKEDGVRKELGDLLRLNLMETGGVSVDKFKDLLIQRYNDYFDKWDRDRGYPQNNRGINNPYKKGTGKVIEAFYKNEQLKLDLENAQQFENDLDQINEQISNLDSERNAKKSAFEKFNPLKEGIRQRQLKQQKLNAEAERKEHFGDINKKWPVLEDKIKTLEPDKKKLNKSINKLNEELKASQNLQKAELLRSRIEKLNKLEEKRAVAENDFKESHKIEESDLKNLRALSSSIRDLKAQINAARLTYKITSQSDTSLVIKETDKEAQELQVKGGKIVENIVSGSLSLKIGELEVQIISGDGDLEKVIDELKREEKKFTSELKKLKVESLQDAESYATLYKQTQDDLNRAKELFQSELGDDKIEDLNEELKSFGDLKDVRSVEDVSEDLADAKAELRDLESKASEAENQIDEWNSKYGSLDDILELLGEASINIKRLEKELQELPELPEEFESEDDFIKHVENLNEEIRGLEQEIGKSKIEKAKLEGTAPELSSEELLVLTEEAEEKFNRIKNEAETFARVKEKAETLLVSMDANTYKGLENSFVKWLNKMTDKRFSDIELNEDMPEQFSSKEGQMLPFDLLSHGTKDTVCLAWRFALTEHFLQENMGFVVLDDPMVDMDPERRVKAVKAIQEFSTKYQVIVTTCHPEHAEDLEDFELAKVG